MDRNRNTPQEEEKKDNDEREIVRETTKGSCRCGYVQTACVDLLSNYRPAWKRGSRLVYLQIDMCCNVISTEHMSGALGFARSISRGLPLRTPKEEDGSGVGHRGRLARHKHTSRGAHFDFQASMM